MHKKAIGEMFLLFWRHNDPAA